LIAVFSGAADPQPLGPLSVVDELEDNTGWAQWPDAIRADFYESTYGVTLMEAGRRAYLIAPYTFPALATVEIAARQVDGPADAGYGLWWGAAPPGHHAIVMVNGDGYYAVLQSDGYSTQMIQSWQTFPWVLHQDQPNRLRVDVLEDRALIRLNDEATVTVAWGGRQPFQVGFVTETFLRGGSQVAFDRITIWHSVAD
jgi:hypothetical protein